ncbi:MAG: hypothetical protein LBF81_06275 [Prevotellaceae bacterium]|jgi:hypothetical protein|nr:hypothetical protein [Prevotellaceae bacterium]
MKQLLTLLFTVFSTTIIFAQVNTSGNKEKVAVYVTGRDTSVNKIVGNQLILTIVKQKKYTAVERSAEFLAQLQAEQSYQRSGNVDAMQISRVGKQFGVDIVCVAEITEVRNTYDITVKLIDVETAEIAKMTQAYSHLKTIDDLTATVNKLAAELLDIPYVRKQRGLHLAGEALYLGAYGWGGAAAIGYRINNYVALGAGGGFAAYAGEHFSGAAIPVFADLRVNILPGRFSPYVAVAAGACFDTYTNTNTYTYNSKTTTETSEHKATNGYYNVAAGLYVRCSDVFALHAGAGFNSIVNTFTVNVGFAVTFVK